jgi:hypothetical protein
MQEMSTPEITDKTPGVAEGKIAKSAPRRSRAVTTRRGRPGDIRPQLTLPDKRIPLLEEVADALCTISPWKGDV